MKRDWLGRPWLLVSVAVLALAVACGPGAHPRARSVTDGQNAYLASDSTGAVLIRWTQSGSVISGTVDASNLKEEVSGGQAAFTGTLRGHAVSFEVNGKTWTGTLDGDALIMHVPQADGSLLTISLAPGDIDAYNAAVAALHQQGEDNAQAAADGRAAESAAAAVRQADARIGRHLEDLATALRSMTEDAVFTGDLDGAASDLGEARADYKIVQQDVAAHDCPTAEGDAATVDGDAATLDGDVATIDGDVATVESDITAVHEAFSHLSEDVDALRAALAASPSTATRHSEADVDAAIGAANKPIQAARRAEAAAKARVADLASEAHRIARQAEALANGCS